MTCDACWELRHCRGRNCQDCSVCKDIREDKFDLQKRYRLKPKQKERGTGKPRGPRPYHPRPVIPPAAVVPVLPMMAEAIAAQLKEGVSVMHIVNHTSFTEAQVKRVKADYGI